MPPDLSVNTLKLGMGHWDFSYGCHRKTNAASAESASGNAEAAESCLLAPRCGLWLLNPAWVCLPELDHVWDLSCSGLAFQHLVRVSNAARGGEGSGAEWLHVQCLLQPPSLDSTRVTVLEVEDLL